MNKIKKSTGVIPPEFEGQPDRYFDYLQADVWINKIRVPVHGVIDIEATANKIGIPLRYDLTELTGEYQIIEGLTEGLGHEKNIKPIVIRIKPNIKDRSLTFCHEVGHYFLDIVKHNHCYYPDQAVEDFCEYFGTKMLNM